MDDESVLKLIMSGDSEQIERKEQLRNKKPEVCQAICAFANDFPRTGHPGMVVIRYSVSTVYPARLKISY